MIGSDTSLFVVTGVICQATETYDTNSGKPKSKIFVKAKKEWNGGGFESVIPITVDDKVVSQQTLANIRLGTRIQASGYLSSFEKEGTNGTFYNLALSGQNVAVLNDEPEQVPVGAAAGGDDVPF